jgi:phenylpropionate dioxygenase-like ring-hydroxylating dioxygenase large terminal subunit
VNVRSRGTPPIQRLGPLANTAPVWKRSWVAVARAEEVPDNTPVQVLVAGDAWVLTRMDGMLTAFEDRCPHQRSPLSAGSVTRAADGTPRLSCAYHGWRFDGTGRCDLIPGRGKWARFGQRARLRPAYGVTERYGLIWLAAREPLAPLPEFPEWAGDAGDRARSRTVRTQASACQLVEGFLDGAHLPFARAGSGAEADAAPDADPPRAGRVATDGWRVTGVFTAPHQDGGEAYPHRVITTAGPHATAHVRLELPSATIGVLLTCQPEDWGSTRVFTLISRGALAEDATRLERFLEQEAVLLLEDLGVPRRRPAAPLPPEDHNAEAGARADRLSVAWRRLMARAVYDQRHGV